MKHRFACVETKMDAPRKLANWRLFRTVAKEINSELKAAT